MLTVDQLTAFARDGYLVVPGVVDADRCARAVARIDEQLAERPPAEGHTGHYSYVDTAEDEPLLMATLTESPAWQRAAELVAPLRLEARPQVQVALTFPPYPHRPGGGHVDGLTPPGDDGPESFTMLAGIVLSDQTRDDMGNLWVWPGTHRRLAHSLRSRGADAILSFGAVRHSTTAKGCRSTRRRATWSSRRTCWLTTSAATSRRWCARRSTTG